MKYLHKILNNCDEVSLLALRSKEAPLPLIKHLEVAIHLYYCRCCSNFVKQSKLMDKSLWNYFNKMGEEPPFKVSKDFKEMLKQKLK
jgi:hypothetical protein